MRVLPYAKRKLQQLLANIVYRDAPWWTWRKRIDGNTLVTIERQGGIERIFIQAGLAGYEFTPVEFSNMETNLPEDWLYVRAKKAVDPGIATTSLTPKCINDDSQARISYSTFYGRQGEAIVSSENIDGPRHVNLRWTRVSPLPDTDELDTLRHFDQTGCKDGKEPKILVNFILGIHVRSWARYGDVFIAQSAFGNDGKFVACDKAAATGGAGFETLIEAGIPSWAQGKDLVQDGDIPVEDATTWRFSPRGMSCVAVRSFREINPGNPSALTTGIHEIEFVVSRDIDGLITEVNATSARAVCFDDVGFVFDADYDYKDPEIIRTVNLAEFYGTEEWTQSVVTPEFGSFYLNCGPHGYYAVSGRYRSKTNTTCQVIRNIEWRNVSGATIPDPYRSETIAVMDGPIGVTNYSETWYDPVPTAGHEDALSWWNAEIIASSPALGGLKSEWVGYISGAGRLATLTYSSVVEYPEGSPEIVPEEYKAGTLWTSVTSAGDITETYITPWQEHVSNPDGGTYGMQDNAWMFNAIQEDGYWSFSSVMTGLDLRTDAFSLMKLALGPVKRFDEIPHRRADLGVRQIVQVGSKILRDVAIGDMALENTPEQSNIRADFLIPRTMATGTRFTRAAHMKNAGELYGLPYEVSRMFDDPSAYSVWWYFPWRRICAALYSSPNGDVSWWFRCQAEPALTMDGIAWNTKDETETEAAEYVIGTHEGILNEHANGYSVDYTTTGYESVGNAIWTGNYRSKIVRE